MKTANFLERKVLPRLDWGFRLCGVKAVVFLSSEMSCHVTYSIEKTLLPVVIRWTQQRDGIHPSECPSPQLS